MKTHASVLVAVALLVPCGVSAQGDCTIVKNSTYMISNANTSQQTTIFRDAEAVCSGGKRLKANTIATSDATGVVVMDGDVVYTDGENRLTANLAQYYRRDARLQADGNVEVTDLKTGSKIRATSLMYYQPSASRKEALMITAGSRAQAILKSAPKPGAAQTAQAQQPTTVDADVIEIRGQSMFRGNGNSVITRTDMRGYGNLVVYEQSKGDLTLTQAARIETDQYRLQGDTIYAVAAEGEQLREVRASKDALLSTNDVRVESPFLRIYLDSGKVNRLVATRPTARAGQPVSLPRVTSKAFNMSADSIDASAPGQVLTSVVAVGHAFGERIDTLPPPAVAKLMPDILTNDWLRGDTLRAFFVDDPNAKPDSAGHRERMLQQIVAVGQQASSALRTKQPNDTTYRIYYALADRITVDFEKGVVLKVVQSGNTHGLFLSPEGAAVASRRGRNDP